MLPVYYSIACLALVMIGAWALQKLRRRNGTLQERHFAFPPAWLHYLNANVPLYRRLPLGLRTRMQDSILNFVDGKRWKHCGGLDAVTDEMKISIAGQACFLLLNRDHQVNFSRIHNILLYPKSSLNEDSESENALPPVEAWPSASVVLVWDAARKTALDMRDGCNPMLDGFARQLAPDSASAGNTGLWLHTAWARVMSEEFTRFSETGTAGNTALPPHSGEDQAAEFFAAATELFFELPDRLRARNAELYTRLQDFFKLNPVQWQPAR